METIVTGRGQAAHDIDGRQCTERLGGLSPQQLTQAMIWLAGYSPQAFDAALDAIEPCASDGSDEPEPFCARCGADIGIFLKFGLTWRHYRGASLSDVELFEPGHAPVVAWRVNTALHV